jgi:micrococcal nuclease
MSGRANGRDGQRRPWRAIPKARLAPLAIAAAPAGEGRIRAVTDGDTFRLESGERIRIAAIDAPETHADQAKCATEIALGEAAAAGVRTLLDHRPVSFVRVGRSYNCSVARMTFAGRDLGAQRVARGVARWWPRGAPKPDWCGPERRR